MSYAGDTLSMFIILPDQSTTLADVESKLTSDDLVNVAEKFSMASVKVKVGMLVFVVVTLRVSELFLLLF